MQKEQYIQELVKRAVYEGRIPRYLYKYKSLKSNFDKILIDQELWFSTPDKFNDPFDCQIQVDTTNSQEEKEQFLNESLETFLSSEKNNFKIVFNNDKIWDDLVNRNFKKEINKIRISCFGSNQDNILMWSHYADYHAGVCLKFDVLADPDFFKIPLMVNYQPFYPIYNPFKGGKQLLVSALIGTKSDIWKYEEEVRIVKLESGPYKFKKTALVEVIFGCKTNQDEINKIKKLATDNNLHHLKFSKAILKKKQYGLDFLDL